MAKEEMLVFKRVFVITVFIFFITLGLFFFRAGDFSKGLTGFSVKDTFAKAYNETSITSKIFLIIQWVVLISFLAYSFVRDRQKVTIDDEISERIMQKYYRKNGTDLDVLYSILKDKKILRVSSVSKFFKIDEEVAMDWCKTLESGNLASIEYPLGGPIIKIN